MPSMWMDVDVALAEVPVNSVSLMSSSDFVTVDEGIAYNESGMDLYWHFVTTAGVTTVTSVTPTTSGVYDWAHQDHGMYTIEIPASGGGSINNDREGFGYFTGVCDAVLPWRGPTIGFRAVGLNDKLCNWLYSPYRGLAGTALPNANADAPFGIPTSDAGGLDLDTQLANTHEVTAARMGALTDLIDGGRLDLILDIIAADTTTDIPGTLSTIAGYLDTEVAAIKAVTDVLPDAGALTTIAADTARLTAARAAVLTDLIDGGRLDLILDGLAKTGADSDTLKTLSDEIAAIEGGTGTGARSVTITVDDGSDALENATVRFTEGANTYAGGTNASGVVAFSLDDATYAVTITKTGYTFTPTTLVVDGTEAETYSMTAISITAPPNASTTTGVMTVYDEEGSVEESVEVSVQIIDGPGTDGIGYDSAEWTETSSAQGLVEFAGIILGARYKIWRGDSKADAETFTAPTSGDSFDLPEVIGRG